MKTASYDASAALYDAAFDDIKVRELEWGFIVTKLKETAETLGRLPSVLEIGCGNGQLLRQLFDEGLIEAGTGLDVSTEMLAFANRRHAGVANLTFQQVTDADLGLSDQSFDLVISFLSFRYLDWERIADQIERLGQRFLMVDMATTELLEEERGLYEDTRDRTKRLHAERPEFAEALCELVKDPAWHEMLKRHPRIQATSYEEFLTSRFPQGEWERLYVCFDHSLFTFTTGL